MAAVVAVFPVRAPEPPVLPPVVLETSLERLAAARASGDARAIGRAESAVVEQYRPLADRIARRYRGRGVEDDDLAQLARFGLFKAVRRWCPERSPALVQFATPTIEGEIKRYFRDYCRPIRMPRSLQEDLAVHQHVEGELMQQLGRSPSEGELAERSGSSIDRVRRQRLASRLCQPVSAETSYGASLFTLRCDASARTLMEVDDVVSLGAAIRKLTSRERRILHLRFLQDLSQSQIAAELGVSQMHVSRMLRAILARLHTELV